MEDSSLTGSTAETTVVEPVTTSVIPEVAKTPVEGGQQAAQTPTDFDYEWYKKDPRWGKMWKEDRDISKSYFEADKVLETKYKPAFKEYESLTKQFKDLGIESSKIPEYIKEYQELKNPANPRNQRADYFSSWLDNPKYQPATMAFFQDMEKREMAEKFPGMNEEQIKKQVELENRLEKYEQTQKATEQQKFQAQTEQEITKGFSKIKEISEARGFQLTDEVINSFYKHCTEQNVPVKYMVQEFMSMHSADLDKGYESKVKANMLKSQKEINTTKMPMKGQPKIDEKKKDFGSRLGNLLLGK